MKKRIFLFFLIFGWVWGANSQTKEDHVKWVDNGIELDGELNEAAWSEALPATDFWQHFPTDSLQATYQTEIRMLYDEKFLYVGIIVYAPGKDYVVPSLRRDFRARGNDNISLMFDTFNDGNNAFFFGTNPEGVQREALIAGGGSGGTGGFNTYWDVKWQNASSMGDDYYIS